MISQELFLLLVGTGLGLGCSLLTRVLEHFLSLGEDRKKREREREEKRKQQAAELAELFSLWLQESYDKTEDRNLMRYELQKKYWELALWLDAPVLQAVHNAFKSAAHPGIEHKKALIAVRRVYLGGNDPVRPEELFHWDSLPIAPENPKGREHA